jgi:hypothetical protein
MARVQSSRSLEMPLLYNVDQPVGSGWPNQKDDVLLVQYLLKSVYDGRATLTELPLWSSLTLADPIMLDGIFGIRTATHLHFYQKSLLETAPVPNQKPDSRVDPARSFTSMKWGMPSTIVWLNTHFRRLRPRDYLRLGMARDLPDGLAKSLCIG